jgi:hypothetical protein
MGVEIELTAKILHLESAHVLTHEHQRRSA